MISVDFNKPAGVIKPLHGINNGPLSNECVMDSSHYYMDIGIPFVRLHDTDWPSFKMVDIPKIFPVFEADAEDPANYLFKETDQTIEAIVNTGAQILYRLGTSIEHSRVKRFTVPPKDNTQWAKICLGIIRHYNEGWAEGFHYGIKYWEIWNEPENASQMFYGGTAEDYYNLYVTSTRMIHEHFPDLKLGGYAAGEIPSPESGDTYFTGFLDRVKKENVPLDFFSWHIYTDKIEKVVARARYVKQELDKRGFDKAEIFMDEWNYFHGDFPAILARDGEYARKAAFDAIHSIDGATFALATIITLNREPVDIAYYYDGQPRIDWCGLFDMYGVPIEGFYAMRAYGQLYRDKEAVTVSGEGYENIHCLASKNHVLLANYRGEPGYYTIDLQNLEGGKVETYVLDGSHPTMDLTRTEYYQGYRLQQKVFLDRQSVVLLKRCDA